MADETWLASARVILAVDDTWVAGAKRATVPGVADLACAAFIIGLAGWAKFTGAAFATNHALFTICITLTGWKIP